MTFNAGDLERIQKELNSDTMLLEYALGDDHSYLWAVTSNSSDVIYCRPQEIEDAVREFNKVLTARQGIDGQGDYGSNVTAADSLYLKKQAI